MAAKCPVREHQWKITAANIADTEKKLFPNSEMVLGVNKKNKMIVLLFCIFLGCLVIQVLCR